MAGLDTLPTCVMSVLVSKLTRCEQGALRLVSTACQQQTHTVLSAATLCTTDFKQLSRSLSQLPSLKSVCIHHTWPDNEQYTSYTQVSADAPVMAEAMSALTALTALTFDVAAAMRLGSLKWAHLEADRALTKPENRIATSDDGEQPSANNNFCAFFWVPDCLAAAPNLQRLVLEDPHQCGMQVPQETRSWLWLNHKVWASKLTCLHLQNMIVLCDRNSWTLQHLTRLQHLSITGSYLPPKDVQHLVQQLHSCQQLTGLQLSGNNMWELPKQGWEGLTGLKLLDVSHSNHQDLPIGLSCLTALTALHVNHMGLDQLPAELSALSNMVHVCASHNWLSGAGSTLSGLLQGWPQLSVLELDNVSDKHGTLVLPSQLTACRHLRELSMRDNYSIDWKSLQSVLPRCKGLEVLRLTKDVANAKQLQELCSALPASCTVAVDDPRKMESAAISLPDSFSSDIISPDYSTGDYSDDYLMESSSDEE